MSRFRNTARSLSSGYLAMGSNVLYTLASVPLALHFLSKDEFGLWAVAAQVASYLILLDFGVSGAVARILIDHKDNRPGGEYGSVIKTSFLVFVVQGITVGIGGCALAFWVPGWMRIPAQYIGTCRILIAVQCVMTGVVFGGRLLQAILQAHQRSDANNYSQMVQFAVGFSVQWIAFYRGMGVYSLLVGGAALQLAGVASNYFWVARLGFLPSSKESGKANWRTFNSVFLYGSGLFLILVGLQLLNASQVVIVSWKLGLAAAAVWTVATKVYPLAFQLVTRLFDFSISAFGEMVARGERANLERRFRQVLLLTTSGAVFVAAGVAVCNESFVAVWTKGKISWEPRNDVLLGALLLTACVSKCLVGMIGASKQIGAMSAMYFLEGVAFVIGSYLLAPHWGITGVLLAAVAADIVITNAYGLWRLARYFQLTIHEIVFKWLANAWIYLLMMIVISTGAWWLTRGLGHPAELPSGPENLSRIYPLTRLLAAGAIVTVAGLPLLWRVGLTPEVREELRGRLVTVMPRWAAKVVFTPAP